MQPPTDTQSARVGDVIAVSRDVLVEIARTSSHAPPSWRFLPSGSRGKLIGWRERVGEQLRAVIDVEGVDQRLVVFVQEQHVAPLHRVSS